MPGQDTQPFDADNPAHTFHSCYVVGQAYHVMPYVYSGFDTPAEFVQRIEGGVCPGGWDRRSPLPAGLPGRYTRGWSNTPPVGLGYRTRVLDHLAGIDCSGYVLRCWGFSERRVNGRLYRSANMASLCVPVTRETLKAGDMLIWTDRHVRLFHARSGDGVNVSEACGGEGYARPYQEGDLMGCVIQRDVEWEAKYLPKYLPYSPFPQLVTFQIAAGRTIQAELVGSGVLAVVECTLDGAPVACQAISTSPLQIEHVLQEALPPGRHEVRMTAVNRIAGHAFQEAFVRQFYLS
jgi:hypothetical protein